MEKIYEAMGEQKESIISVNNDYNAFLRQRHSKDKIGIEDIVMIGRIQSVPIDSTVDIHWNLNGLRMDKESKEEGNIIIVEPLKEQIENGISNINEVDTCFEKPIKLSKKAIILMPLEQYNKLCKDNKIKRKLKKMNVRLYEGEEELAIKMLLFDRDYIYLKLTKDGYDLDGKEHRDALDYTKVLIKIQKELVAKLKKKGQNVTYGETRSSQNSLNDPKETGEQQDDEEEGKKEQIENYRMITGLTKEVEGETRLDDELSAATDIGKVRENQEDALLLIKDKNNPKFKMMVVADGMGGLEYRGSSKQCSCNKS